MNRDSHPLPPFVRDLLYAGEHRLLDDDVGRAMARIVACGVDDDGFAAGDIQQRVERHRIAQAFAGPFAIPHLSRGDLTLGGDQRRNPIQIPIQYFNAHSFTLGGSGSGKTIKSLFIAEQVARHVDSMWLFDLCKREFAKLRPTLARHGIDLVILQARDLRLNPLQVPPHVSPADWASRVSDMLVQVFQLPPRATKLLHATVLKLYRAHHILDGGQEYPTLFKLRATIAKDREANAQARMAIVDSLEPTLQSLGEVLCHRQGQTSENMAKRHLIFELGGIAETDKDLLLNTLVWSEFASRVARGISNPRMDLWICLDEAQRLVSPTNPSGGITDLLGLVRGTGVGVDLSVQSANVAPSILSNTATKFIGRCGSAADYDAVGSAMGLTVEQRRWMAMNLRPGLFVGQIGEGDWRQPFVFQVPLPHPSATRQPRTDERRERGRDFPLTGINGGECQGEEIDLLTPVDIHVNSISHSPQEGGIPPEPPAMSDDLSEAEIRYLRAVIDHPGQPSSTYPKIAGMGARRAQGIRQGLVERGFLREHNVSTGQRGRAATVLEPLELAHRALSRSDDGRGGDVR